MTTAITDKPEKDPRVKVGKFRSSLRIYVFIFVGLAMFSFVHLQLFWTIIGSGLMDIQLKYITPKRLIDMFQSSTHEMLVRQLSAAGLLFNIIFTAIVTTIIIIVRHFFQNRYLSLLSNAARRLANGDFTVRVTPRHSNANQKDFIDVLLDDFNTMAEELATANEKLTALSVTDELTGLNNRRAFMEYADLIWRQNHRLKLPVSVIVIDVDYFKKYNDTLGHLEGDKALIAVAQCLKKQVKRETDFVARFGGEEFICFLPFVEKESALDFAEELVRAVEGMKLTHPASESSQFVTISAGLATTVPDSDNAIAQLLETADKALYEAKSAGRNRVAA